MVDLAPSNAKLAERSLQILESLSGADRSRIEGAWAKADDEPNVAAPILDGRTPERASAPLEQASGAVALAPREPA